jgi:hypothetical protein
MILGGNKILGAVVLVVVTQVFTFGAVFALRKRKSALLLEQGTGQGTKQGTEPGAGPDGARRP